MAEEILIRRAVPSDADSIADAWLAAFRETYDFPPAHSDDDVRAWVRDGLRGASVEQLYLRRPWTGRGIGSRLIALAREASPDGLELWTFQVNAGARRFYERHGFAVAEMTDGRANEERQPDVRYVWLPGS